MTLSPQRLSDDRDSLLTRLVADVGDDDVDAHAFERADWGGLPASWATLMDEGLVRPVADVGADAGALTPAGWLRGLELSATVESEAFNARIVQLLAGLKGACDRSVPRASLLQVQTIAPTVGLPVGWVLNVVRSGLLARLFPDREMGVYWDPGSRGLRIPSTFNHQRRAGV